MASGRRGWVQGPCTHHPGWWVFEWSSGWVVGWLSLRAFESSSLRVFESSSLRVFESSSLRVFEPSSLRAFESSPTRRRVGGWQAARCARRCSRQAQACRLELQRASRCPRQRSCSDSRRLGCSGIGNRSASIRFYCLTLPHLTSVARRRRRHTRHILGLYMVRHDVVPDAIPGVFGQVLAVRRGKGTHEQQLTGGVNSSSSSSSTPTDALVRSPLALPPVRSSGGRGDGAEFRDHRERKAGTHSSSLAVPVPAAVTPTLTLTPSPSSSSLSTVRPSRRSAARHQRVSVLRHRRRAV